MRGVLLWTRRGIWSRRIWWRAARSLSWQRPTACIAVGSTSSWPVTAKGGYDALEPRSRAPRSNPNKASEEVVEAVVSLREQLLAQGHDGGAQTIAHHLAAALRSHSLGLDDLADPAPRGTDRPPAPKAPALLADPLRGRAAQRDVAGRHHPLAPGRRAGRRDPQHDRRPLPPVLGLGRLPDRQGAPTSSAASARPMPARGASVLALRQRRGVHRDPRAGQGAPCRSRWNAWASLPRTRGPTTPRPAARSSACTRP